MRILKMWVALIVLAVAFQPEIALPLPKAKTLAMSVSENSGCDWAMDGKTSENIRVADDSCGPQSLQLEKIWVNMASFSYFQPPVVSGNRMYCCSDRYSFYCLDALTGSKIWEHDFSSDELAGEVDDRPPVIADNRVYISNKGGLIYCLSADDGKQLWRFRIDCEFGSDVLYYEGKTFFLTYKHPWREPLLWCLNAETGDAIWKVRFISNSYSGMVISKGKIFATYGNVFCIDASNGKTIWESQDLGAILNPCVFEGKVIFNTYDGTIRCLNAESGELIWENKKSILCLDLTSPTVYNDKVYISTRCIDIQTVKTIWENESDNLSYSDKNYSECSFCNGRMYVSGLGYRLVCFDAKSGKKLWCYGRNYSDVSVPVIANGLIYLPYKGYMCCFGNHKIINSVRIELSSVSDTVSTYEDLKITAKVYDDKDNLIENAPLDWSVQPDFAYVSDSGILYSSKPCKALITCRSNDLTAHIEISVTECDEINDHVGEPKK